MKEPIWDGWERGGRWQSLKAQISETEPRDFIGRCPSSTSDVLDGNVHLMSEPGHARLAGGILVMDITVHTLPGKCALSMTRPEKIVHVTAVYRHPLTLLHPPGEEVSNHGATVPTLITAEQEETIAWRAPRCSGSIS